MQISTTVEYPECAWVPLAEKTYHKINKIACCLFWQVPVMYFQTKVSDDKLRTYIKPRSSVPYAWDEPTLPPHLTLTVQGGTSATYNMNSIADGDQLCYENFIYLCFSATFKG